MLMPMDLDAGSSPPTSTLAKRPRAQPLVHTIDKDGDSTDVQDSALELKKLKKMASQPAITVLQNEALIIEINNIDNMKTVIP
jgi:hypothetical protein